MAFADALKYSRKLVAKSHTGPQPQDVIFAGVVGAKSGTGQVRIAALKQYGLLKGDAKVNYSATELAKRIEGSPQDEVQPLLREAMLKPAVFKKIFDTFHGDNITRAKIRQRVLDLDVHPEEADNCVNLYVAGCSAANLVVIDGEKVVHVTSRELAQAEVNSGLQNAQELDGGPELEEEAGGSEDAASGADSRTTIQGNGVGVADTPTPGRIARQEAPRAVFNVNVTLDSSLDIEKLQKQLELLKRFGAI